VVWSQRRRRELFRWSLRLLINFCNPYSSFILKGYPYYGRFLLSPTTVCTSRIRTRRHYPHHPPSSVCDVRSDSYRYADHCSRASGPATCFATARCGHFHGGPGCCSAGASPCVRDSGHPTDFSSWNGPGLCRWRRAPCLCGGGRCAAFRLVLCPRPL
jgi:hypothetical protein